MMPLKMFKRENVLIRHREHYHAVSSQFVIQVSNR
jgi:hypothetical protein